jgi:hypothetical protein
MENSPNRSAEKFEYVLLPLADIEWEALAYQQLTASSLHGRGGGLRAWWQPRQSPKIFWLCHWLARSSFVAARTNGSGWSPMGSDSIRSGLVAECFRRILNEHWNSSKLWVRRWPPRKRRICSRVSPSHRLLTICNICQDGKIIRDSPDEIEASGWHYYHVNLIIETGRISWDRV